MVQQKSTVDVAVIICGNKNDRDDREVSPEEAQKLADELRVSYFETSAKVGHNINILFEAITRQALVMPQAREPAWEEAIELTPSFPPPTQKSQCSC